MKKNFYILILILTLASYASVFIPPHVFWVAGFFSYLIPFLLILNIVLLIRDVKNLRLSFLVPLGLLITGWGFIRDTVEYSANREQGSIRILSYNIRAFNIYDPDAVKSGEPEKMTDWIRGTKPDIICLQEFYNEPGSSDLNTIRMINPQDSFFVFSLPVYTNRIGAQFGAVIFSRYPIIDSGAIRFTGKTQNQAIFADLAIQSDTVRVYNLHLQSMHINEKEMMNYEGDIEEEVRDLFGRLKSGFIQRSVQIRTVREHIEECPYHVIVCGDLNDLPYSYTYHELKSILHNSFAESGRGFGFTYNGRLPFLRIDNQFYSSGIRVHSLRTDRKMKYSDHFPVIGTYSLQP